MVIVAKEFNIRCISCKLLSFVPVMEFGNKCREEKNILASFGNLLQGLLFLVVLFRSWVDGHHLLCKWLKEINTPWVLASF